MKVRLYKALDDHKFMELLADSSVTHVSLMESDHCALVIDLHKLEQVTLRRRRRRRRVCRYENMWQHHNDYMAFVQETWDT